MAFVVENRPIWVPPAVMALSSPVFYQLFYSDLEGETIELKDKKFDEILELMRCLIQNPTMKKVDGKCMSDSYFSFKFKISKKKINQASFFSSYKHWQWLALGLFSIISIPAHSYGILA